MCRARRPHPKWLLRKMGQGLEPQDEGVSEEPTSLCPGDEAPGGQSVAGRGGHDSAGQCAQSSRPRAGPPAPAGRGSLPLAVPWARPLSGSPSAGPRPSPGQRLPVDPAPLLCPVLPLVRLRAGRSPLPRSHLWGPPSGGALQGGGRGGPRRSCSPWKQQTSAPGPGPGQGPRGEGWSLQSLRPTPTSQSPTHFDLPVFSLGTDGLLADQFVGQHGPEGHLDQAFLGGEGLGQSRA